MSFKPSQGSSVAVFVCLLLCIRLVGGFNGNTDKTLCWSAVCAASVSGRRDARWRLGNGWMNDKRGNAQGGVEKEDISLLNLGLFRPARRNAEFGEPDPFGGLWRPGRGRQL